MRVHKDNCIPFYRYHDITGIELLNSVFLLHPALHISSSADNRRDIHDRPEDHKIALEGMQSVLPTLCSVSKASRPI